jgi:hypothetical protein
VKKYYRICNLAIIIYQNITNSRTAATIGINYQTIYIIYQNVKYHYQPGYNLSKHQVSLLGIYAIRLSAIRLSYCSQGGTREQQPATMPLPAMKTTRGGSSSSNSSTREDYGSSRRRWRLVSSLRPVAERDSTDRQPSQGRRGGEESRTERRRGEQSFTSRGGHGAAPSVSLSLLSLVSVSGGAVERAWESIDRDKKT